MMVPKHLNPVYYEWESRGPQTFVKSHGATLYEDKSHLLGPNPRDLVCMKFILRGE